MRHGHDHDSEAATALDHFWDRLLAGESGRPADHDPADAAAIRAFHALVPHDEPDPQFVARLEVHLMDGIQSGIDPTLPLPPVFGTNGRDPRRPLVTRTGLRVGWPPWDRLVTPGGLVMRLAAAIVLLALVAGAAFAAFYPLQARNGGRQPLLAFAGTPAAPQGARDTPLLNLTLPDVPTFHAYLGIGVVSLRPGLMSEGTAGTGPFLLYVVDGPLQLLGREGPQPVRVIPPGTTDREAGETVAAGQEVRLDPGATLAAPAGSTFTLHNTGSGTARLLWLLGATAANVTGANWAWAGNGGTVLDVTGPLSVGLRQMTLDPDETLPAATSAGTRQAVSTRDPQRVGDMRTGSNDAVRNAADEPLEVYVLTLTSGAGTATPMP